jgi:plasmid maintenance system antidote protein VapI
MRKSELMAPVHPGEILREDFMKPLGLSVNKLALELHVPATRIGEIVHERRRRRHCGCRGTSRRTRSFG